MLTDVGRRLGVVLRMADDIFSDKSLVPKDLEKALRGVFDEQQARLVEAERIAIDADARSRQLERLAWRRLPVVRNLDGWRVLVVIGPVVLGIRRRG